MHRKVRSAFLTLSRSHRTEIQTADSQLNEDQPVTSSNGNHLDHPENWTTGGEPATEKQKAFIASLAKQKGEAVDQMGLGGISKSGASERIDELQSK